jgi:acetyl esterase
LAAPLKADDNVLLALPPLYLVAAGIDPLLSDTLLFAERLKAVGRDDPLTVVPGVTHGFLQNTNELVAAREALTAAGEAVRGMIRGS